MRHAGAISFALVLGSMTVLAQTSGRTNSQLAETAQLAVLRAMQPSGSCPVDMQAQRQISVQSQAVTTGSSRQAGPFQELHVTFTNSTLAQMVGMRLTVYGFNAKGQLSPAQATASATSTINKTVDLKLTVGPQSQASIDLRLAGFTSVSFINVDSIHYAGGSTWHPSAAHTCRVFPNGMMLISSR
jgi:hypothetical protein